MVMYGSEGYIGGRGRFHIEVPWGGRRGSGRYYLRHGFRLFWLGKVVRVGVLGAGVAVVGSGLMFSDGRCSTLWPQTCPKDVLNDGLP